MDEIRPTEMVQRATPLIKEVKAILHSRGYMFKTRGEIKEYVESPLLAACEHFWDLNVRTLSSTANAKDITKGGNIIIDYDSLSEKNKQIAKKQGKILENYKDAASVILEIPVEEASTVDDVKEYALKMARQYQKQKATWIPCYTLQEEREWHGIDPDDEQYGVDLFVQEGLYYDPNSKRFYESEEHFRKATETEGNFS